MCPVCRMLQQAIRSAIKTSVASSWHFISTYQRIIIIIYHISSRENRKVTCVNRQLLRQADQK